MAKIKKIIGDYIVKTFWDMDNLRPKGFFDLSEYMRHYEGISFHFIKNEDGTMTAVSDNFRYGSIITSGRDDTELDKNIKDAIFTSFEIPSVYASEIKISRVGAEQKEYALA